MHCLFCEKSEHEVRLIITKCPGSDIRICDECIKLCHKAVIDFNRMEIQKEMEQIAFAELWGTDV